MQATKKVSPVNIDDAGPFLTINEWCAMRRASRATCYRLLANGHLRAVKAGHKTLIETASAREEIASLVPASFRPAA